MSGRERWGVGRGRESERGEITKIFGRCDGGRSKSAGGMRWLRRVEL